MVKVTNSEHVARCPDDRVPGVTGKILCSAQWEEVLTKACQEQRREDGQLMECARIADAEDMMTVTAYPEGHDEQQDKPDEAAETPEEPDQLPEPEDTPLDDEAPNRDQVRILRRIHVNLGHPTKEEILRALRLGRARPGVLRWVKSEFRCPECEANRKQGASDAQRRSEDPIASITWWA